ncbi:MAG TPA: PAS domain S-box protein [Candidatus Binatia bacterium]|jgi:PAS domain S-box-containing protein|nr:PAS domain S-box protein [Candidatus Binatia bacterium]
MSTRFERDADIRRVLVQRIRAGLWLLLLAIALFVAAYVPDGHVASRAILTVKAVQLATILAAFALLRGRVTWNSAVAVALVVLTEVCATTAVSGVLTAEVSSIFLLFTVLTLATATLLPWGVVPQIATVLAAGLSLVGNVAGAPAPPGGLASPTVAVLLAFATSIYIAHAFEQHRRARARAERDLRVSEARKAAIIESALDAIITVDAGGRIVEYNPAAERMFGHPRANVLGRALVDVLTPSGDGADQRNELTHHLTAGAGAALGRRIETTARRADGGTLPVELALLAIERDDGALRTGFVHDLTERNLAAEARTASTLARVGREMLSSLDSALLFERLGLLTTELLGGTRSATLVLDTAARSYIGGGIAPVPAAELSAVVQRAARDAVAVLDPAVATRLLGPAVGPTIAIALHEDGELVALHLTTRDIEADPFTPSRSTSPTASRR